MTARKVALPLIILLAFVGFLDATYLTAEHYAGRVPPCSVLSGCETVTTSEYATFLGVPISLFGAGYFLAIVLLAVALMQTHRRTVLYAGAALAGGGFVAALVLFYLQLFVLEAICLYCALSDSISIILFILFMLLLKYIHGTSHD
jgi:uncharacterized membrane protein